MLVSTMVVAGPCVKRMTCGARGGGFYSAQAFKNDIQRVHELTEGGLERLTLGHSDADQDELRAVILVAEIGSGLQRVSGIRMVSPPSEALLFEHGVREPGEDLRAGLEALMRGESTLFKAASGELAYIVFRDDEVRVYGSGQELGGVMFA